MAKLILATTVLLSAVFLATAASSALHGTPCDQDGQTITDEASSSKCTCGLWADYRTAYGHRVVSQKSNKYRCEATTAESPADQPAASSPLHGTPCGNRAGTTTTDEVNGGSTCTCGPWVNHGNYYLRNAFNNQKWRCENPK